MPLTSDMGADGQGQKENGVHVFCPLCFTVSERACFYDYGVPLSISIFKPQPSRIALIQINLPIYKPPQNIPEIS